MPPTDDDPDGERLWLTVALAGFAAVIAVLAAVGVLWLAFLAEM